MRKQILVFVFSLLSLTVVAIAQNKDQKTKQADPPKAAAVVTPAPTKSVTSTDSGIQIPSAVFQQGVAELQEIQKLIIQEQDTIDVLQGRLNVLNAKLQKEIPAGFTYQNGLFVKAPPEPDKNASKKP